MLSSPFNLDSLALKKYANYSSLVHTSTSDFNIRRWNGINLHTESETVGKAKAKLIEADNFHIFIFDGIDQEHSMSILSADDWQFVRQMEFT